MNHTKFITKLCPPKNGIKIFVKFVDKFITKIINDFLETTLMIKGQWLMMMSNTTTQCG
jgi:hypothetical protein